MPIKYDGIVYYWTLEVCRRANISRSTLLRWLEKGLLTKVRRDRRGWRLFTDNDILVIIAETGKMTIEEKPRRK
jgi:predicted site-specific integrase-resolvase